MAPDDPRTAAHEHQTPQAIGGLLSLRSVGGQTLGEAERAPANERAIGHRSAWVPRQEAPNPELATGSITAICIASQ
jgi:hypothetical protein